MSEEFFKPIFSELDEHVIVLPYIASVLLSYFCLKSAKNVVKLMFGNLLKFSPTSLRSARHHVKHFNPGFSASLSTLVLIILSDLE